MLRELRIKNFAVIDEVALALGPGLNVLTGETGAGKSIVLNAPGLICSDRGASDIIRHKAEEANVEALSAAWSNLTKARESLEQRRNEKSFLEAQAEEIVRARLSPGEEEALQATKNLLVHAEKLHQGCREGEELLYEGQEALVSRLGKYASKLRELTGIDETLKSAMELLDSSLAQLQEATAELRRYADRIHFEPGALEQLEDRLADIHRLKRKYHGSVEDILRLHAETDAALKALDRGEEEISALEKAFDEARRTAWDAAQKLSLERQRIAKRLKKEMEKEIEGLGMPHATFEVRFITQDEKEDQPPFFIAGSRLTAKGMNQVEFYFSPNPGEPLKPLGKIASGGELSRLMLAIKSLVLTPADIPTMCV